MSSRAGKGGTGFTIVELLVVIAVIGILAGIAIISFGSWKSATVANQLKSDLANAASAMERDRNFGAGYPLSLPSDFNSSDGINIVYAFGDAKSYCLNGSADGTSSTYHIDNQSGTKGAEDGLCPVASSIPGATTGFALGTISNTSIAFSWSSMASVTFTLQCSTDSAFVSNVVQRDSLSGTSGTITGLNPLTTYFCRQRAVNSNGPGNWSSTLTATTNALATPGSPVATAVSGTRIDFSWGAVSGATYYVVQISDTASFNTVLYQWPPVTVTSLYATDREINTRYYFRVRAVNADTSAESSWATANATTMNVSGSAPIATSIDGYFTTAPDGYLLEDGSAVSRTTYSALFAAIGTTYGAGNGSTTFNLPDSRGRATVNLSSTDSEFDVLGEKFGTKAHQLTITEMPSHTHIQNAHNHNNGGANPYVTAGGSGVNVFAAGGSAFGFRYNTTTPSPNTTATNQNTGNNESHNNIQPSIVKRSAIKYTGVDPTAAQLAPGTSLNGYWSVAPTGYLIENGSAVSRTTYSDLFSAVSTTYGAGNGSTTFNLPDSRGKVGVNLNASDAEFDTLGAIYGEKAHQLTLAEMPSHTHVQNAHNHNGGFANPYVTDGSIGSVSVSSLGGSAFGYVLRPQPNTVATNQNTGGDGEHNEIQPSIVKLSVIKHSAASTGLADVPVGSSVASYAASIPSGYLYENGSAVSRTTYAALFATIGTTYGAGNGSTTFNIPDSRGRVAVNINASDAEFDVMGEKFGTKTHLVDIGEMPSHTHIQNAHNHNSGIVYISDGNFGGTQTMTANGTSYGFRLGAQPNVAATNQNTGGGGAHNNIQPSIVKRYMIRF